MKLVIDIDSTVLPLLRVMSRLPGGERVNYRDCESWDYLPQLCGGVPQMLDLFDRAFRFENMVAEPPFAGCAQYLRAKAREGAQIQVMTDSPQWRQEDVARYLEHFGVPFDGIDCLPQIDKVALMLERGLDVLVDDKPDTVRAAHRAGIRVFTLHHRYVAGTVKELGLPRCETWKQIGAQIDQLFAVA